MGWKYRNEKARNNEYVGLPNKRIRSSIVCSRSSESVFRSDGFVEDNDEDAIGAADSDDDDDETFVDTSVGALGTVGSASTGTGSSETAFTRSWWVVEGRKMRNDEWTEKERKDKQQHKQETSSCRQHACSTLLIFKQSGQSTGCVIALTATSDKSRNDVSWQARCR